MKFILKKFIEGSYRFPRLEIPPSACIHVLKIPDDPCSLVPGAQPHMQQSTLGFLCVSAQEAEVKTKS